MNTQNMKRAGVKKKTQVVNDADEAETVVVANGRSGERSGGARGRGDSVRGEIRDDMRREYVEEEEEEGEDGGGEERGAARPKLDEGYYEIEAIRRKRFHKREVQYLIKWRGWPESDNTWEPLENLETIPDAIEAFEERLKLRRKRKLKCGGSNSQSKKKKQQQSLSSTSDDASEEPDPYASFNKFVGPPRGPIDLPGPSLLHGDEETHVANHVEPNSGSVEEVGQSSLTEEEKEYDPTLNELRRPVVISNGAGSSQEGGEDIGSEDDNVITNGLVEVNREEVDKDSGVIGAKKRKTGTVERIEQSETTSDNNQTTPTHQNGTPDVSTLDPGNNLSEQSKVEELKIVKIIMPVGYSTYITNNRQDTLVTFLAVMSNGKKVRVDNKFLRARNPHLLLNFYEQHIKYSP